MIDVLVYVTGLALVQFTGDCSPAIRVLLPAGGYKSSILLGETIHAHTWLGKLIPPTGVDIPIPAHLALRSAEGNSCLPPEVPSAIPAMNDVFGQGQLREDCQQDGDTCKPLLNGHLTLSGNWRVQGVRSCGGENPTIALNGSGSINFVDVRRPWAALADGTGRIRTYTYGNGVLLRGQVQTLDQLPKELQGGRAWSLKTCSDMTKLSGIGVGGCVVVQIENSAGFGSPLGAADPHFASYYDLFLAPPSAPIYLPAGIAADDCVGGGGTPGNKCSPVTWTGR